MSLRKDFEKLTPEEQEHGDSCRCSGWLGGVYMNMREEFEKLSHAEKVHLFIGSVAIVFFILGAVTGIFWRELGSLML